jgi:hypothetical protein
MYQDFGWTCFLLINILFISDAVMNPKDVALEGGMISEWWIRKYVEVIVA